MFYPTVRSAIIIEMHFGYCNVLTNLSFSKKANSQTSLF